MKVRTSQLIKLKYILPPTFNFTQSSMAKKITIKLLLTLATSQDLKVRMNDILTD